MDFATEVIKLATATLALIKVVLDLVPKTRGECKKKGPKR